VKAKEQNESARDGSERVAVLLEKFAHRAGGSSQRDEHDGKAKHEGQRRSEQAGAAGIFFAKLLDADAGEHGDVARDERKHAGREKRDQPGEKGGCEGDVGGSIHDWKARG